MKTRDKEETASNALFIRLGKGSSFFEKCRNKGQVMLDYREVDHQLCVSGNWEAVRDHYINEIETTKTTSSNHIKQLQYFYSANAETIWITFHDNKMWWCKAKVGIKQTQENLKIKSCDTSWSDCDINGNILFMSNINGRITAKRGFLGQFVSTIRMIQTTLFVKSMERGQRSTTMQMIVSRNLRRL